MTPFDSDHVEDEPLVLVRQGFLPWAGWFMLGWAVFMHWNLLKLGLTLSENLALGWRVVVCALTVGTTGIPFVMTGIRLRQYAQLLIEDDKRVQERRNQREIRDRLDTILAKKQVEEYDDQLRNDLLRLRDELS